ncbi:MAG: amino acid transporter ATPase [Firmicutes bacterium]|nr:amino acid transporter ATPase [Bacillota bacterium]
MLFIADLCAFYGEFQALFGVNITVKQGEVTSIVGPNGAGKSTLLRAVSGLVRTEGRIEFEGQNLRKIPAHRIVDLGLAHVPEGRGLFPYLTVRENLELGSHVPRARPFRAKNMEWVYHLFPRLLERERQLAHTLSGGEQQMVAIGRGLMSRPKLLILDEPSIGLAPKMVSVLFNVIEEIRREGVTVLLVEQNVHRALMASESAYVIENGAMVLSGSGSELLQSPQLQEAFLGLAQDEMR